MGMFDWLFTSSTPNQVAPQPITLNASTLARVQRHAGRLLNLYTALSRDPKNAALKSEIEERKTILQAAGYTAPINLQQAQEFVTYLRS